MPRTLVSLRIDDDLRARLATAARRRRATPSELVRRAVEEWLDRDEGRARVSPAESLADVLGRLEGGARDRSTRELRDPGQSGEQRGAGGRSRVAVRKKK